MVTIVVLHRKHMTYFSRSPHRTSRIVFRLKRRPALCLSTSQQPTTLYGTAASPASCCDCCLIDTWSTWSWRWLAIAALPLPPEMTKRSRLRRLKNDVPKRFVLAPLLFNIYRIYSLIGRTFFTWNMACILPAAYTRSIPRGTKFLHELSPNVSHPVEPQMSFGNGRKYDDLRHLQTNFLLLTKKIS